MQRFVQLFEALDRTTSTNAKVAAIRAYLDAAPAADAAWGLYMLSGRRRKRLIGHARLRAWLVEASGLPAWLVEDSYAAVGDLAETIALLMARAEAASPSEAVPLREWMETRLAGLAGRPETEQAATVIAWWERLDRQQAFLVTKLLTGGLRVGVSNALVARAVAEWANLPKAVITQRLMGDWQPSAAWFARLTDPETRADDAAQPYPFFLASPVEVLGGDGASIAAGPDWLAARLGPRVEWLAEWKWDGIRVQLIRRAGLAEGVVLWSRGEELITARFPEVVAAAAALPVGTVLDGELLGWRPSDGVRPFAELQPRLNRKQVSRAVVAKYPVRLLAYDCLEVGGEDIRAWPLDRRRSQLHALLAAVDAGTLGISPALEGADWHALTAARASARERGVEGLMLKRRDAPYRVGRVRGDWWKWKLSPRTVDAVLIYAQAGHGRRATLYTDYTFAVWAGEELVPVTKAYSGLDDSEIATLDRWIRRHTISRYGPVRAVEPVQVFELAFEGIARSRRHKSGLALRFPRILRWRSDKGPAAADRLEDLQRLVPDDDGLEAGRTEANGDGQPSMTAQGPR